MHKEPFVSIIMNCLNSSRYLREAIDSIYAQTYKNWEIIFWDNGSTDASPEIAKSYDSRLRYFRNEHTVVPLGEARNRALREARGDYIGFLDCDDLWLPEKLEKQIPLFQKNPNVGLVYSDSIDHYQSDSTSTSHFRNISMSPRRGNIFSYLLSHIVMSMPTVVLRKKALYEQSDWFEPAFQICTDYDLFLRIAHDWECDYVDEPLTIYRIHDSTIERYHKNIAQELAWTVQKFHRIYPDFSRIHESEIRQCNKMIAFQEAKSLWRDNKLKEARRIYLRYIGNPKFITAFIASFFSFEKVMRILNTFRKKSRNNSVL